jgi:hypothetical protein
MSNCLTCGHDSTKHWSEKKRYAGTTWYCKGEQFLGIKEVCLCNLFVKKNVRYEI